MRVRSLGWKDPLVWEMASHSSILAWKIPLTEEPGGLQSMVLQGVGHDLVTKQQEHVGIDRWNGSGDNFQAIFSNME